MIAANYELTGFLKTHFMLRQNNILHRKRYLNKVDLKKKSTAVPKF